MALKTNIEWCDITINFWSGCTMVSPGCSNCYAKARDDRHLQGPVSHWGKGAPRLKVAGAVKAAVAANKKPWICDACGKASRDKPFDCCKDAKGHPTIHFHRRRVFSLSLGDWLDKEVPIEWLAEMLATIRKCNDLTWILCTKQPENFLTRLEQAQDYLFDHGDRKAAGWIHVWRKHGIPPASVILLTSVENQATADERIPLLLRIPAACHGISLEPMLEPVDISLITDKDNHPGCASFDVLKGHMIHHDDDNNYTDAEALDWVILGGESGPDARPCNAEWFIPIVEQCQAAGVPVFVKQLGAKPFWPIREHGITSDQLNPQSDKKGGNILDWPKQLRVREFPSL